MFSSKHWDALQRANRVPPLARPLHFAFEFTSQRFGAIAMRILCFLFLAVFAAAVGAFAYYNQESATIRFWEWEKTTSMAMIAGAAYGLGMLSGWTVVGMLRRSTNRAIETVEQRYAQQNT